MRSAYPLHPEDDDWGQAGTLVREVMDDAQRQRLVNNVVGYLLDGVTEPVLARTIDPDIGDEIEKTLRARKG